MFISSSTTSIRRDTPSGWKWQGYKIQKLAIPYWIHVRYDIEYTERGTKDNKPRGSTSSMPGISAPGFWYSSGDTSVSTSDKPTKYTSKVPIIKPASVPSETPTKDPYHVSKESPSIKTINMLIDYPSVDKTSAPITLPNGNQSSNHRYQTISDPDGLNWGIQEAQESMQINIILLILHIILSSTSRQGDTQTLRWGSMRISYIGVNKLYYETRALFSSTSSRI